MIKFDGNKLKRLREYEGLTLQETADKLGVKEVSVMRWERGERIPKVTVIENYCNVFKVKADYFFIRVNENSVMIIEEAIK